MNGQSRRTLGSILDAETRARVRGDYDPAVAAVRIGRADEAFEHVRWGVAYSALAFGSVAAGLIAVRRWVDDLEQRGDDEVVAVVLEGVQ